jgi:hypothetical protein
MEQHAAASGLSLGQWLDFTIADLAAGGQLLNERREQNVKLREMHRFANAINTLMRCESVEQFLKVARLAARQP